MAALSVLRRAPQAMPPRWLRPPRPLGRLGAATVSAPSAAAAAPRRRAVPSAPLVEPWRWCGAPGAAVSRARTASSSAVPPASAPPPPGSSSSSSGGQGASGSGASGSTGQSGGSSNTIRKVLIWAVKGIIWVPAALFWGAVAWGVPLDFRTDEEVQEDEQEVRRLERFFDVEHLPESEYLVEWRVKEEALADIIDKVLRSHKFLGCLLPGAYDEEGEPSEGGPAEPPAKLSKQADYIEVSYVLPPPGYYRRMTARAVAEGTLTSDGGPRPWRPRIVLAHRDGSLAMLSAAFEHVARGKDREERWACTSLRADLISYCDGETTCEPICDLRGPLPHGVRYMRI